MFSVYVTHAPNNWDNWCEVYTTLEDAMKVFNDSVQRATLCNIVTVELFDMKEDATVLWWEASEKEE